jgi:hypothetical protein
VHKPEKDIGDCVYMDLWGPAQVTGIGGVHWLMHLVEGHCGGPWVYFLTQKTAVRTLEKFKLFKAELETQTGKKCEWMVGGSGLPICGRRFAAKRE